MFGYHLDFENPAWLLLALLLPVMWWASLRSLSGLSAIRRWTALLARTAVVLLLIAALAEAQFVWTSDRITVFYLLDQSSSIPESQRQAMKRYFNDAVAHHREQDDKVGAIVFGRDAAIEIPPFAADVVIPESTESLLDPDYTNLAAAIRMAEAAFPHDAAKRIVIISDGNENIGNVLEQARGVTANGIGIDVVPIAKSRSRRSPCRPTSAKGNRSTCGSSSTTRPPAIAKPARSPAG
jgi:hypothetical protein